MDHHAILLKRLLPTATMQLVCVHHVNRLEVTVFIRAFRQSAILLGFNYAVLLYPRILTGLILKDTFNLTMRLVHESGGLLIERSESPFRLCNYVIE